MNPNVSPLRLALRLFRWLLAGICIAWPASATAAAVVVTTPSDSLSTCAALGTGTCSLRDAITFANNTDGIDEIAFSIGSGPQTIRVLSPLPAITRRLGIAGWTQPGIELDGSLAGPGADGIRILAGSSGVSGLSIYGFGGNAIVIAGGGGSIVTACFLGVDHTGTLVRRNGGTGVLISGSAGNWIGYPDQFDNVIAGNHDGIRIEGPGSDANILYFNLIGVNYDRSPVIGNLGGAIVVRAGSGAIIFHNEIFGSMDGISVGPGSEGNVIQGNVIGGVVGGNGGDGILVDGSSGNLIGGDNYLETANSTARNGGTGMRLTNGANDNLIIGNIIGTDEIRAQLGNGRAGISVEDSNNNVIGGAAPAGNLIAFNGGAGISVVGRSVGNRITRNAIVSNRGPGIDLGDDGVTPNHGGSALKGPNDLQNYPIISQASASRIAVAIEGRLDGAPGRTFIIEVFASVGCHSFPSGDFGDGQAFLGSITITGSERDAVPFAASFTLPSANHDGPVFPGSQSGRSITATATDEDGNTSEFSPCIAAASDLSQAGRRQPKRIDLRRVGS